VIRFKNVEVMENLKEVLEQIKKYLTPSPSPEKGEGSAAAQQVLLLFRRRT
jgi:hypothetical protein